MIYSLQNYFDTFYDYCPITSGDINEFERIANQLGLDIKTFRFEDMRLLPKDEEYVLVDCSYIDDSYKIVNKYQWCQAPKTK